MPALLDREDIHRDAQRSAFDLEQGVIEEARFIRSIPKVPGRPEKWGRTPRLARLLFDFHDARQPGAIPANTPRREWGSRPNNVCARI